MSQAYEEFDNSQLSPYFNVDDIRKIRDFHGDMILKHGKPYEEYLYERRKKNAEEVEAKIEKRRQQKVEEKAKETTPRTIYSITVLFISEIYKTALSMPGYIEKECGKFTPINLIKTMLRDTVTALGNTPFIIAKYIKELLDLNVSFEEIAEGLNAKSEANEIKTFYEKYYLKTQ